MGDASQLMEMQEQNCIFCKIISGEIPSKQVYSDDTCIGILDINPANDGHVLLIPKKHYQVMPQVPPATLARLSVAAKNVSQILLQSLSVQGTTIFIANGAVAGQKSPHFMIHVIPRVKDDGLFKMPKNHVKQEELKSAQQKILARFNVARQPPAEQSQPAQQQAQSDQQYQRPAENQPPQQKQEAEKKDIDLDDISKLF